MFTGIITHVGKLARRQNSVFIFYADHSICKRLQPGVSIAVNGACLTVLNKPSDNSFSVAIMPETQQRTMLGNLKPHDPVNLELPMTIDTLLSGHIIQGHIDGTAKLRSIIREGNSHILTFSISHDLSRYIVTKGSIAVNGVSLAVIEAAKNYFTVGIIPHTWQNTMFSSMKTGNAVNVEIDILAKYVERLCKKKST